MSKPPMLRRSSVVRVIVLLAVFLAAGAAHAQPAVGVDGPDAETVFVNVHTITMEDDRVRADQVVLVRRGRIVAMGSRSQIPVPSEARLVDGRGGYLLPGLTDAHVHLDGDGTATGTSREDFGDAPLYLAHGVTSIFNLRGLPAHLEWRERIARGELIGPTIYTAGEFVNEPRVFTPDEVRQEIDSQAELGFDLIKFHEIYSREGGTTTTVGLPRESYHAMNDAARAAGLPLIGHAPVNLDLDAMLEARQSIAHLGALSNVYFLPFQANRHWLVVTAVAFGALLTITVTGALAAIVTSRHATPRVSRGLSRVRLLAEGVMLAFVLAAITALLVLPGGPLFGSDALRVTFTALCFTTAIVAGTLLFSMVSMWNQPGMSPLRRAQAVVASISGLALLVAALAFWIPMAWRSSDNGIAQLAQRLSVSGITVQTTLVAYDAIGGPGKQTLAADPTLRHLRADVQARWQRFSRNRLRGYRYTQFMEKVASALHRAGVPLMAGTDAMGFPLVTPGSSLHRELELLTESGLTPYEAIRSATVTPAAFLGHSHEFGTIAPGRRADLLLIDRNPLDDVSRLRDPAGVMARGVWYTRADLQRLLANIDGE